MRLVWPRRSRDGSCLGRGSAAAAASAAASSSASPVSAAAAAAAVLGTGQATQQQQRWQQQDRAPRNSRARDEESRSKRRHRQKMSAQRSTSFRSTPPAGGSLTLPALQLVAAPIRAPNERDQRQLVQKKKKREITTASGRGSFPLPIRSPPPHTHAVELANALPAVAAKQVKRTFGASGTWPLALRRACSRARTRPPAERPNPGRVPNPYLAGWHKKKKKRSGGEQRGERYKKTHTHQK